MKARSGPKAAAQISAPTESLSNGSSLDEVVIVLPRNPVAAADTLATVFGGKVRAAS
jgi:hypothetical protein